MTPEELRRDEANRWLAQARKDLNAAHLLVASEPSRSVFHSQQALPGPVVKVCFIRPPSEPERWVDDDDDGFRVHPPSSQLPSGCLGVPPPASAAC